MTEHAGGPTVSVVVPCYDASRTLPACLAAIARQTYPLHEVVVVDDASADDTAGTAARAGCRVLVQEENRGVSAARNAGVAATTGEVVFFVDADVALAPDAVATAVQLLRAHPECGIVHGIYAPEPLFDDGPVEHYRILHENAWRLRHVGEVHTVVFALAAVRREVFDQVGPLHEGLRDCEDVEFSSRLAGRVRVRLSDRVVGWHDDGHRLAGVLSEQWRRALPLVPVARAHAGGPRLERANRLRSLVCCAGVWATLPLPVLSPWLVGAPVLLLAAFAAAEPATVRYVHRVRGTAFTGLYLALHFLRLTVLEAGAAVGAVQAAIGRGLPPVSAPGRTASAGPGPPHPSDD